MGKHTTCLSRFMLSYDMVFLALVRMSLGGEKLKITQRRCFVHPFRKRPAADSSNPLSNGTLSNGTLSSGTLIYCSKINAILSYHKLRDDIHDEKGMKKLGKILLLPLMTRIYKRSFKVKPAGKDKTDYELRELNADIAGYLAELSEVEKRGTASVDVPAEVFGKLLARIFECGLTGDTTRRIAREIGMRVGRWIYIIDAYRDYDRDTSKKHKSYNPLALIYRPDEKDAMRRTVQVSCTLELMMIEKAVNLIDFSESGVSIENIIKNIIYLGMTDYFGVKGASIV
jgi:hypothetical protein